MDIETNMLSDMIGKVTESFENKKFIVLQSKLEELGIVIDYAREANRRFQCLTTAIEGNKETIYYNDESVGGQRVVTFVTKPIESVNPDGLGASMTFELTHY